MIPRRPKSSQSGSSHPAARGKGRAVGKAKHHRANVHTENISLLKVDGDEPDPEAEELNRSFQKYNRSTGPLMKEKVQLPSELFVHSTNAKHSKLARAGVRPANLGKKSEGDDLFSQAVMGRFPVRGGKDLAPSLGSGSNPVCRTIPRRGV